MIARIMAIIILVLFVSSVLWLFFVVIRGLFNIVIQVLEQK